MKQPLCAVRPVTQPLTQPGPVSNIPVFYPDDSEIENLDVPPNASFCSKKRPKNGSFLP